MIYELRSYALMPGRLSEYLRVVGEIGRPIRGDTYGKLEGHFRPVSGNVDRIVHLWSYADMTERERLRGELAKNDRWTREFLPLLPPLVDKQENRILTPVRPVEVPSGHGHVYELRVERTPFGGARRRIDALLEAIPSYEPCIQNVGVWQTSIGTLNEIVHLWAHPDLASVERMHRGRLEDPRWKALEETERSLVVDRRVELLIPSPFSPMA